LQNDQFDPPILGAPDRVIFALRRPQAANEALQQEIIAWQETDEARRRAYTELEQLVQERTAALAQANAAVHHEWDVLGVPSQASGMR